MGCSLAPFLLSFLGVLASYQGIWCIPCSGMGAADLSEIRCSDFPSGAGLGVPHVWMRCALPQPPAAPPSSSGAAVGATNPCNIHEHPQGPGGAKKGEKRVLGCRGGQQVAPASPGRAVPRSGAAGVSKPRPHPARACAGSPDAQSPNLGLRSTLGGRGVGGEPRALPGAGPPPGQPAAEARRPSGRAGRKPHGFSYQLPAVIAQTLLTKPRRRSFSPKSPILSSAFFFFSPPSGFLLW